MDNKKTATIIAALFVLSEICLYTLNKFRGNTRDYLSMIFFVLIIAMFIYFFRFVYHNRNNLLAYHKLLLLSIIPLIVSLGISYGSIFQLSGIAASVLGLFVSFLLFKDKRELSAAIVGLPAILISPLFYDYGAYEYYYLRMAIIVLYSGLIMNDMCKEVVTA